MCIILHSEATTLQLNIYEDLPLLTLLYHRGNQKKIKVISDLLQSSASAVTKRH